MLSDKEIYEFIPKSFILHSHKIDVQLIDEISGVDEDGNLYTRYGDWNEVKCLIRIAKGIKMTDENGEEGIIPLIPVQLKSSFYHEFFHACEFFGQLGYNEQRVQFFANLLVDFLETRNK